MLFVDIVLSAFIFILPAYIANSSAAWLGGGAPIDCGRRWRDGKRILGDGKTFRGLFLGILFGTLAGLVEGFFLAKPATFSSGLAFFTALGFLLSTGALSGDIVKSFVKRRLSIGQGRPAPMLDQLDFVVGAIILASPLMLPSAEVIIFLLIVTPAIHLLLNFVGYKLKCKRVPW